MNCIRIRGMGSLLLFFLGLILLVRGDRNDPELYVADYYPQDRYQDDYYLDYPAQSRMDDSNNFNKRVLSSFRERMEREKSKEQQEKIAQIFLEKLQQDAENRQLEREYDDNKYYIEMIQELWEKYKNSQSQYDKDAPVFMNTEGVRKRGNEISADYSTLGWSGIGYRKRSPAPGELELDTFDVDLDAPNPEIYSTDYLYAKRKRFPVAKRSSNFYKQTITSHNNNKQLPITASGTDPKVVQDLRHIFGNRQNFTESESNKTNKINKKAPITMSTSSSIIAHEHLNNENNVIHTHDEPLNIQKKSIDWSNYFGIDRRKKKSQISENDIDNDWLIKRYNKAVAMAIKRSSEYPLNFFRNHKSKKDDGEEQPKSKYDETKLRDMDDKLKNIEDLIIDEALKYTGAHEDEADPAEIQEIKDKVISRLAAAYSLEKMRRALSEFKSSLTAQKNEGQRNPSDFDPKSQPKPEVEQKEKKSIVPCTSKSGRNCDAAETVNDVQAALGRCEAIETRCHRLMSAGYNSLFYPLCKWHQLCYLCQGEDEDDIDIATCDLLFVQRADALCHGDVVCAWTARPALQALRQLPPMAPHCNRDQICAR